jgi:hypothetical protein
MDKERRDGEMKWAGEVAFFLIIVLVIAATIIAATIAAVGCIGWILAHLPSCSIIL